MHGADDTIVSPTNLLEAKEYFNNHKLKIKTKLFEKCEHRIPVEGVSLGLYFLKKNFYT
jgi:predicted esterase